MDVNFNLIDAHVWQIKTVDIGASFDDFMAELKTLPWNSVEPGSDLVARWQVENCYQVESSRLLSNFKKFFESNDFKKSLVDLLMRNETFLDLHPGISASEIMANSKVATEFIKTPAQYLNHPLHYDSHTPYAHGMLYFIEGNHPDQSTWFVPWGKTVQELYPIETGFSTGWLLLATKRGWHKAVNSTDNVRYSFKFALVLADPTAEVIIPN